MLANIFAMGEPLLALAAALLRPGGRLVYLFPTFHTQVGLGSIVANVLPLIHFILYELTYLVALVIK